MGVKIRREALQKFIVKYKYVLAVIVVGLLLMSIPENQKRKEEEIITQPVVTNSYSTEAELEKLLCQVDGAGEVRVLLTALSGEEIVYKTDRRGTDENTNTVIITDSDRNQSGLIQQRNPPIYRGAVVVCTGADKPDVRLAITDAVRNATGLRSDQISVLKMK